MSKQHVPPVVEQSKTAVAQQQAVVEQLDTSTKVPTEKVPTTPATIYQNGINNFVKFIKGEFKSSSLQERANYQCEFMGTIVQMLSMDSSEVSKVLDHFIVTILDNPVQFSQSEIFAPLYVVEKEKMKSADELLRYKQFMTFMINLAKNAQNRKRFVANVDMRKLLSYFPKEAADNLQEYCFR